MEAIIKYIRESGLNFLQQHNVKGYSEDVEKIEVYEAEHRWDQTLIAKYILIPATSRLFSLIAGDEGSFREFEDHVISPFYFQMKGDWSWNLYICFVLSEDEMPTIPLDQLNLIRRGKRFGKKIVLTESQVAQDLPVSRLPDKLGEATAENPLSDWLSALGHRDLLFCLESNSPKKMNSYLNGQLNSEDTESFEYKPQLPVDRPRAQISAVHMGSKFRSHVLADTQRLSFGQVNLLEGPNGMGKTSILECIELAFTGKIQRNLLAGMSISEDWDGTLEFSDLVENLHGVPETAEQKIREVAYYRHKVSPRRDSQLNQAFHQYNYFSSEKIHQFCFNTSQKLDYRGAFARVIFGEQLEQYERHWKEYKEKFESAQRQTLKEVQLLETQVKEVQKQHGHDGEILQSRIHTAAETMMGWLNHIQSSYPQPNIPCEASQMEEWFQYIQPYLQELDLISEPFANLQVESVDSRTQWVTAFEQLREETSDNTEQLANYQRELQVIPSSDMLEEWSQSFWKDFEIEHSHLDSMNGLKDQLAKYEYIYDQTHSRAMRLQINKKLHELNYTLRPLTDVWNLYESLASASLSDMSDTRFEFQRQDAYESLLNIKRQIDEKEQQILQMKQVTTNLLRMQSELKSSAHRYLDNYPDESCCPLCGHDHESAQLLLHAITSHMKSEDDSLSEYLTEEAQLKLQLKEAEQNYTHYLEEQKLRARLRETGLKLQMDETLEDARSLNESSSSHEVQNVLFLLNKRIQILVQQQKELEERGSELEERGIQLEVIKSLEKLMRSPELDSYFEKVATDEDTYHRLHSYLSQLITYKSQEVEQLRGLYSQFKEQMTRLNNQRDVLEGRIMERQQQGSRLEVIHKQLSLLEETYTRLMMKNITLHEEQSWSEWRRGFNKLLEASNRLREVLEPRILQEQQESEQRKLDDKLNIARQRLILCNDAVNRLSSLKELAVYGEEFVRSNFDAISHMFVSLHSPNEFERLEWTGDDMVAVRKGSGAKSHIYQLSTGQRTSVILSIFFIMHLVMETAPPFLLLDEPVAHMDELNVIGLLDFLRQLIITRQTQLFFTTANPQIAALFRRKFSFLEQQFRVFQLRRDMEGPLRIKIGYFKPDAEQLIAFT